MARQVETRRRSLTLALVSVGWLIAGCTASSPSIVRVSVPPDSAPALVVLQTYLRALVAGDGETAHALATSTFVLGNGELCGADGIRVTSWEILNPYSNDADFAVNLTIDGGNEVIHPGNLTWFYEVVKTPDSAYRLAGGGSGP